MAQVYGTFGQKQPHKGCERGSRLAYEHFERLSDYRQKVWWLDQVIAAPGAA